MGWLTQTSGLYSNGHRRLMKHRPVRTRSQSPRGEHHFKIWRIGVRFIILKIESCHQVRIFVLEKSRRLGGTSNQTILAAEGRISFMTTATSNCVSEYGRLKEEIVCDMTAEKSRRNLETEPSSLSLSSDI